MQMRSSVTNPCFERERGPLSLFRNSLKQGTWHQNPLPDFTVHFITSVYLPQSVLGDFIQNKVVQSRVSLTSQDVCITSFGTFLEQ